MEVPQAVINAHLVLDSDSAVGDALLMYHQAVLLRKRHPSIALVAFISVIETLAQIDEKPTSCPTCKHIDGSTHRFKRAVARVLQGDAAKLLSDAYTPRSETVHRGVLHGSEHDGGEPNFEDASSLMFEGGELHYADDAARAMLWECIAPGTPVPPLFPG